MSGLMKLGECNVQLIGGQIMSRITANVEKGEECIGSVKVIIPKCIQQDGSIRIADMPEEQLKTEPDAKRIVKDGDIVMKLSSPYDAALVDKEIEGSIVPSFCAIVKNGESIDTGYLLAFLNSDFCKDQLRVQVSGSAMSVLSVGKVANVKIPIPSINKQKEIGDTFIEAQRKLKLIRQIAELESKKNDIVFRDLVKDYE